MQSVRVHLFFITLCLVVFALSACTPVAPPPPTSLPEEAATPTSRPAEPTAAPTDTPKPTPEPSPTEQPASKPTVDPGYQAILDYFQVTSTGKCQKFEDGSPETLITAKCEFGAVEVHLDQFGSASEMNAYMDFVQSEYPSGAGEPWTDSCTSSPGGVLYTFMELDDSAWLLWSVNGQNMVGEAIRADGDMDALKAWWEAEGVLHLCP